MYLKHSELKLKTKRCSKCGVTKTTNNFHGSKVNKDKLSSWCKTCGNEQARKWQQDNKDVYNAIKREQYNSNPQMKIAMYGRNQINCIINKKRKHNKFLVECGAGSREKLMNHLISTIPDGYTLADYGTRVFYGKLCVDHIVPCSKFDLTKRAEYLKCFNYKNLQLITKEANAIKYNN